MTVSVSLSNQSIKKLIKNKILKKHRKKTRTPTHLILFIVASLRGTSEKDMKMTNTLTILLMNAFCF